MESHPRTTKHAERRFRERAARTGYDPNDAWSAGIELRNLEEAGINGHEARYHEPTDTVLIRKNENIVTVKRASWGGAGMDRVVERAKERNNGR